MLINLTADLITLPNGTVLPSAGVAWVPRLPSPMVAMVADVPVYGASSWGAVEGLPDPVPGVWYIVSDDVAGRCPHRDDVVSPSINPKDGVLIRLNAASPATRPEDRLSERAARVLLNLRQTEDARATIAELAKFRRSDVARRINVGRITMAEFDRALLDCGLSWMPE